MTERKKRQQTCWDNFGDYMEQHDNMQGTNTRGCEGTNHMNGREKENTLLEQLCGLHGTKHDNMKGNNTSFVKE
jgi:hypothetical protein